MGRGHIKNLGGEAGEIKGAFSNYISLPHKRFLYGNGLKHRPWSQTAYVQILALILIGCVTLDKLCSHYMILFVHL